MEACRQCAALMHRQLGRRRACRPAFMRSSTLSLLQRARPRAAPDALDTILRPCCAARALLLAPVPASMCGLCRAGLCCSSAADAPALVHALLRALRGCAIMELAAYERHLHFRRSGRGRRCLLLAHRAHAEGNFAWDLLLHTIYIAWSINAFPLPSTHTCQ